MLRFVFALFLTFLVFTPGPGGRCGQHDHGWASRTGWEQSNSTRHAVLMCTTNLIWRWRLYIPLATGSQRNYLLTS